MTLKELTTLLEKYKSDNRQKDMLNYKIDSISVAVKRANEIRKNDEEALIALKAELPTILVAEARSMGDENRLGIVLKGINNLELILGCDHKAIIKTLSAGQPAFKAKLKAIPEPEHQMNDLITAIKIIKEMENTKKVIKDFSQWLGWQFKDRNVSKDKQNIITSLIDIPTKEAA